MNEVFLLWHVHERDDRDDDEKLIGVYRTEADAEAAILRLAPNQVSPAFQMASKSAPTF